MAQLRELLKEDQEPFLLKSYIEDRRSQLKRPPRTSPSLQLQLKKPKPISHQAPKSSSSLCKSVCFFSHQASPDPRKSPLFDFPSPSPPAKSSNPILLHIPARTAALLLEAALRIQHKSSSFPTSKTQKQNLASSGILGSILERLTGSNRSGRKREIGAANGTNESRHGSWDSRERVTCISGQCRTVSSESVEDKSSDLETSSSSSSSSHSCEDGANDAEHPAVFSESPSRPSLRRSSSSSDRTPDFASPAPSPTRREHEDEKDCEAERPKRSGAEEEEEKEQCSPVSVLDPPFENDDDESHSIEDEGGFDYECSYAIVQRTKQQLLYKLQRFEKLAELDPIELEKRMLELEAEEDDDADDMEADDSATDQAGSFDATSIRSDGFIGEVVELCFANMRKVPGSLTKLVADLIAEEEGRESKSDEKEAVVKRLCMRMESWKEVDSSTIDMMVENDFRMELDAWKMNQEAVGEMAVGIELAIFSLLVDELSQELA
ncbi:uncharacterized protein LOC115743594 isoform X2 [Rhodamnia argentea]|uniref:Uncharacterized protein LOC115743594 isoform X2 n=1 Tax=Rhodamnia argentea TaxID=178133 RepID=A0A8B8PJF3_9MYRT|nr:uncharacterized protein LOC115743594 isoform X2 [Rhodamnia argentea]